MDFPDPFLDPTFWTFHRHVPPALVALRHSTPPSDIELTHPVKPKCQCTLTSLHTLLGRRAEALTSEHESGRDGYPPMLEDHHIHGDAMQRRTVRLWRNSSRSHGRGRRGIS